MKRIWRHRGSPRYSGIEPSSSTTSSSRSRISAQLPVRACVRARGRAYPRGRWQSRRDGRRTRCHCPRAARGWSTPRCSGRAHHGTPSAICTTSQREQRQLCVSRHVRTCVCRVRGECRPGDGALDVVVPAEDGSMDEVEQGRPLVLLQPTLGPLGHQAVQRRHHPHMLSWWRPTPSFRFSFKCKSWLGCDGKDMDVLD
jgi:hypothetical protein